MLYLTKYAVLSPIMLYFTNFAVFSPSMLYFTNYAVFSPIMLYFTNYAVFSPIMLHFTNYADACNGLARMRCMPNPLIMLMPEPWPCRHTQLLSLHILPVVAM